MKYLVIERFHEGRAKALYERFEQEGRLLPEGVEYIESWVDHNLLNCYQLMESSSEDLMIEWAQEWTEYADFEIIPVIPSSEAKKKILAS